MYVVISGAHGIGKSTTSELVAKKLNGEYLTEALDEIVPPPKFGPKSNEKVEGQLWHIRQLLLKEKRIANDNKVFISDRGWADVYIYSKAILSGDQRDLVLSLVETIPKKMPDVHIIVTASMSKIRERIKKRKRNNLTNWGEDDMEYLKKIDSEFVKFAKAFSDLRPVYLVDISGTLENNAKQIIDIINKHR